MNEDYVELYCIIDRVSGRRVTGLMPCVNSGVAMNGFRNFVKDEVNKGMSPKMYSLRFCGLFTGDGVVKIGDGHYEVCTGENVEDKFNEWCAVALAEENS